MIDKALLHTMLRMYPAQPSTAVWRAVEIDALLRLGVPEGRGLDLGCGDGKLTGVILQGCGPRTLVGIDPDPLETEAAFKTGLYEAVHAAPGNVIPEQDGSFDFVVSNSVLEHIPDLPPSWPRRPGSSAPAAASCSRCPDQASTRTSAAPYGPAFPGQRIWSSSTADWRIGAIPRRPNGPASARTQACVWTARSAIWTRVRRACGKPPHASRAACCTRCGASGSSRSPSSANSACGGCRMHGRCPRCSPRGSARSSEG